MTTTVPLPLERVDDERLDLLVPPPRPFAARLLAAAVPVGLAIGITVLNLGGWVRPDPFPHASFGSDRMMELDHNAGTVTATVMVPNYSQRDVRITEAELAAVGVELVSVEAAWGQDESGPSHPLPVTIPAGEFGRLAVSFAPTDCSAETVAALSEESAWGVARVHLDFGEGAFPSWGRWVNIDEDPIEGPGESPLLMVDGEIRHGHPLALTCEALR